MGSLLVLTCIIIHTVTGGERVQRSAGTSVFADLSVDEMNSVINYLNQQTTLHLVNPERARLTDAAIYLVEAIRPNKAEALRYLDGSGPLPERAARVIIHRGDLSVPQIEEYAVSPIPNPTRFQLIKNPRWRDPIPFNARSFGALQQLLPTLQVIERELGYINDILMDMTGGFGYVNCSDMCLTWYPGMPGGNRNGSSKFYFSINRDIEGSDLHPIGLQFLLNSEDLNPDVWRIEYVWLQGQTFNDITEVRNAYDQGRLNFQRVPDPPGIFGPNLATSLNFRGEPRPHLPKRGPVSAMPDGQRFSFIDRHIKWMGWEFEFSMLASSGIQVHNVRFLNERIAWELSLQEVGVFYSGGSPLPSHATYYDSHVNFGLFMSELFPEIDCPSHAEFFDFVHFNYVKPRVHKNAACIFEQNQGIPLRRHYKRDAFGNLEYAQGLTDNVLILRHILTVHNYDYIIDFIFHQAGQIQGKVSLSGYMLNTFYMGPEMDKYGHVVNEPTSMGNLHHHVLSLKVDLDIKGELNRFETLDIHLENITDAQGETILNRYFNRSLKKTELEAAYQFNFDAPKYLVVYNENSKNKFGSSRGYRILSNGMSKMLLPKAYRGARSRSWTNYQVAVTKYHDNEQSSSSVYASMEQFDPVVSFQDYIDDDENIVDQDLVAWITLGTHHIPHTEDVPIVTTPGVQLSFYLLPYNYFDEDPSLASRDNIRVTPGEKGHVYQYSGVPPGGETRDEPGSAQCPTSVSSGHGLHLKALLPWCIAILVFSL